MSRHPGGPRRFLPGRERIARNEKRLGGQRPDSPGAVCFTQQPLNGPGIHADPQALGHGLRPVRLTRRRLGPVFRLQKRDPLRGELAWAPGPGFGRHQTTPARATERGVRRVERLPTQPEPASHPRHRFAVDVVGAEHFLFDVDHVPGIEEGRVALKQRVLHRARIEPDTRLGVPSRGGIAWGLHAGTVTRRGKDVTSGMSFPPSSGCGVATAPDPSHSQDFCGGIRLVLMTRLS